MAPFATPGYAFDSNASTSLNNPLHLCEYDQCAWAPNYTYPGFFSCSTKLCGLLEYIYAGLWEYVLIIKV